jgi:hypothetical protein
MSADREAIEMPKGERDPLLLENKQSLFAVRNNCISKMENIFKTGGIEQEAIDHLISCKKC